MNLLKSILCTFVSFNIAISAVHAGELNNADTLGCKTILGSSFSSGNLYKILGTHIPKSSTQNLFKLAEENPEVRSKLNKLISETQSMNAQAGIGLSFQKEMKDFLKLKSKSQKIESVLFPKQRLFLEYEQFKRTQSSSQMNRIPEQRAELISRYETSTRYNLNQNYSKSDIINRSDYNEITRYQARLKNKYEQMEELNLKKNSNTKLNPFLAWVKTTQDQYEAERVRNLVQILAEMNQFDRKGLEIGFKSDKGNLSLNLNESNFDEITNSKLINPNSIDLKFKSSSSNNLPKSKTDFWNNLFLNHYGSTEYENINLDEILSHFNKDQIDRPIHLSSTDQTFNQKVNSLLGKSESQEKALEFRIQPKEIYEFLSQYYKLLGKSSLAETTTLADKILVSLQHEFSLLQSIEFLDQQLNNPNIQNFEKSIKTALDNELISRQSLIKENKSGFLLQRMIELETSQHLDLITGIKWYGYRYHHDFWNLKDLRIKPQKSIFSKGIKEIKNKFLDLKNNSKTILLAALTVSTVHAGIYVSQNIPEPRIFQEIEDLFYSKVQKPIEDKINKSEIKKEISKNTEINPNKDKKPENNENNQPNVEVFTVWADHSYFDRPYGAPVESYFNYSKLKTIDSQYTKKLEFHNRNYNHYDLAEKEFFHSKTDFLISNKESPSHIIAKSGYVALPTPRGARLSSVYVYSVYKNYDYLEIEEILHDTLRDQYVIRLADTNNVDPLKIAIEFSTYSDDTLHTLTGAYNDKRLLSLDKNRLNQINQKLKEAGITHFSNSLGSLIHSNTPISISDIEKLINSTQLYALKTFPLKESNNVFEAKYSSYVFPDGKLHMKCDISNEFLGDILALYFENEKDILTEAYVSYLLKKGPELSGGGGTLGSIGHQRLLIRADKTQNAVILDATPKNFAPEYKKPVEEKTKAEKEDEEIKKSASKKEKTESKETSKSKEEDKNKDKDTDKKDKTANFLDYVSTEPKKKIRLFEENPDGSKNSNGSWLEHEMKQKDLDEKMNQLIENGSFYRIVTERSERDTILLPHRVNIIASRFLSFSKNENHCKKELITTLNHYYHLNISDLPDNPDSMKALIQEIILKTHSEWNDSLSKLLEHKDKNGTQNRVYENMFWLEDKLLRNEVDSVLDVLKSYHWIQPN